MIIKLSDRETFIVSWAVVAARMIVEAAEKSSEDLPEGDLVVTVYGSNNQTISGSLPTQEEIVKLARRFCEHVHSQQSGDSDGVPDFSIN